jgi:preprotein translocase subunit SecD
MIHIPRWKIWLVAVVVLLGAAFAAPNIVGKEAMPSFLPGKTINLGLDLRGGSHLLLQVDLASVLKDRTEDMVAAARPALRGERIGYTRIAALEDGIRITLRDAEQMTDLRRILREEVDPGLLMSETGGNTLEARFSPQAVDDIKRQTIEQSIEIVRRRVDETGTNEPVIQRQGDDRILVQLPGLDNPDRIKELLGTTAKLGFHLVNDGVDASLRDGGGQIILPMVEMPGQTLALQRRAAITGDMLAHAAYAPDETGQPAVTFRLNTVGAKRFCDLSRNNVGKPFAIVLDNEIISAPVIRSEICGGVGQISGGFTLQGANDLALLLRAGALPAPLTILEERTVGPSLGADSVAAGEIAALVGLAFVVIFMVTAYGTFGLFACFGLAVNIVLIFAILSGLQASLTLPGIAGIVLTIGMAVDANVLIYERIREEIYNGKSALASFHSGFQNALSSILDSNITTLISAIILMSFGTGPVKGFAVTLSIGIITSMFSAIVFTRLMLSVWVNKNRGKELQL